MECSFKLGHYQEVLSEFISKDFVSITLQDFFSPDFVMNKAHKYLIVRHDIDHDMSLLENMVDIETNLGIRSSNFFRLRAKNYNLLSRGSIDIVKRVLDMKHSVGFHYENIDLEDNKIKTILTLLRKEFGDNVFRTVSPHEPTRTGMKTGFSWKKVGVLGDAYDKDLMEKFKYISDSSCRWREGCMHNYTDSKDSMYILTHPIWWYKDHPGENY